MAHVKVTEIGDSADADVLVADSSIGTITSGRKKESGWKNTEMG